MKKFIHFGQDQFGCYFFSKIKENTFKEEQQQYPRLTFWEREDVPSSVINKIEINNRGGDEFYLNFKEWLNQ